MISQKLLHQAAHDRQWLGKEDAPLLFRIRTDMRQWLWGLQFLRECTPARTRHNIEQIVRLGTYSRDNGIAYDERTQGTSCTSTPARKSSTVPKRPPRRCVHWVATAA